MRGKKSSGEIFREYTFQRFEENQFQFRSPKKKPLMSKLTDRNDFDEHLLNAYSVNFAQEKKTALDRREQKTKISKHKMFVTSSNFVSSSSVLPVLFFCSMESQRDCRYF